MSSRINYITDDKTVTLWSLTHALFGYCFFIILHNYFHLSSAFTIIFLIILHIIYEWKDYYITYHIYENNERKMNVAYEIAKYNLGASFHLPPNNIKNSVGDMFFQLIGIGIGYYYRNSISHTMLNVAIWVSIIYWLFALITYIQISSLRLHDKNYVDTL
jgi:hypothetical protein